MGSGTSIAQCYAGFMRTLSICVQMLCVFTKADVPVDHRHPGHLSSVQAPRHDVRVDAK